MRRFRQGKRLLTTAAVLGVTVSVSGIAAAQASAPSPVCADPAVRSRVFEAVTGHRAPIDGSRYALLSTATNRWEHGDPARAFTGSAAGASIVVSSPVVSSDDVRASITRSAAGRTLGVHFCQYRVPANVSDWSKA